MFTDLLDRPIAFHRPFVQLGAGITGALLLSQAIYWSKRTRDPTGWFYKTQAEWEEETGLSRYEQEGARKKLRALKVLQETKRGVPCKTYYRVDVEQLQALLFQYAEFPQTRMQKTSEQGGGKQPAQAGENQQSITETTTEITAETNKHTASPPLAAMDAPGFSKFWYSGMRKIGKKQAAKAFERAVKRHKTTDEELGTRLSEDVRKRVAANQMGFNRMHPTTYLNGDRWDDEIVPGPASSKREYFHNGQNRDYHKGVKSDGSF